MADFCAQCAEALGFEDLNDLAGITHPEDFNEHGRACVVICEGCGPIQVDPAGNCISPDCLGHDH